MSVACLLMYTSRRNTARVIRHQAQIAAVTEAQRQQWAAYGYRAGRLDASRRHGAPQAGAQIIDLPKADTAQRRNGA